MAHNPECLWQPETIEQEGWKGWRCLCGAYNARMRCPTCGRWLFCHGQGYDFEAALAGGALERPAQVQCCGRVWALFTWPRLGWVAP